MLASYEARLVPRKHAVERLKKFGKLVRLCMYTKPSLTRLSGIEKLIAPSKPVELSIEPTTVYATIGWGVNIGGSRVRMGSYATVLGPLRVERVVLEKHIALVYGSLDGISVEVVNPLGYFVPYAIANGIPLDSLRVVKGDAGALEHVRRVVEILSLHELPEHLLDTAIEKKLSSETLVETFSIVVSLPHLGILTIYVDLSAMGIVRLLQVSLGDTEFKIVVSPPEVTFLDKSAISWMTFVETPVGAMFADTLYEYAKHLRRFAAILLVTESLSSGIKMLGDDL